MTTVSGSGTSATLDGTNTDSGSARKACPASVVTVTATANTPLSVYVWLAVADEDVSTVPSPQSQAYVAPTTFSAAVTAVARPCAAVTTRLSMTGASLATTS